MSVNRPKPYTFIIRGLQCTTVIERMFHVETESEREGWVEAIKKVSERITIDCEDVDMASSSLESMNTTDDLMEKCSRQGTSISRSTGTLSLPYNSSSFLLM